MADIKGNQSKVYEALAGMGYKGIGSNADEFGALMKSAKNREKVYDILTSRGYKGIGNDLSAFEKLIYSPTSSASRIAEGARRMVEGVQQQAQQPTQPATDVTGTVAAQPQAGSGQAPGQAPAPQQGYNGEYLRIGKDIIRDTANNAFSPVNRLISRAKKVVQAVTEPNVQAMPQTWQEQQALLNDLSAVRGTADERFKSLPENLAASRKRVDELSENLWTYLEQEPVGGNVAKVQEWNPETGAMEERYVTAMGNKHSSEYAANEEQKDINKELRSLSVPTLEQELREAYAERERLNEALGEIASRDRTASYSPMYGGAPVLGQSKEDREEAGYYRSALRQLDRQIESLELERDSRNFDRMGGFGSSFLKGSNEYKRGLGHVLDPYGWTFGVADLGDASKLRRSVDAGDDATEGQKALLRNAALANDYSNAYDSNRSAWYRAGKMGAESIQMMPEFLLGMGPMTAAGRAGARYATKLGMKALGEKAMERAVARYGAKALGYAGGTLVGGAGMVNTIQLPRLGAETMNNWNGTLVDGGDGRYYFEGGEDNVLNAILKAEQSLIPEAASEAVGEFLPGVGKVLGKAGKTKIGGKIGLRSLSRGLERMQGTKWYKNYSRALSSAGFHGAPGEAFEEYAGDIHSMMLGDPTGVFGDENGKGGWLDPEKHLDIWLGTATLGAVLHAPTLIKTGKSAAQYYYYKHRANRADAAASKTFGGEGNWSTIRQTIDECDNDKLTDLAENIAKGQMSNEQKQAALNYLYNKQQERSYKNAVIATLDEEQDGEEQKNQAEATILDNSYSAGYNATGREQREGIEGTFAAAEESLDGLGEGFANWVKDENNPPMAVLEYMSAHRNVYSDEQIAKASDYYQAKAQRDGLQQADADREETEGAPTVSYTSVFPSAGATGTGFTVNSYDKTGKLIGQQTFETEEEARAYEGEVRMKKEHDELASDYEVATQSQQTERIAAFEEQAGWEPGTVERLVNSDPMRLSEDELSMADSARQFLRGVVHPENRINTDISEQEGVDIADQSGIDTDMPNEQAIQGVVNPYLEAKKRLESIFKQDENLAGEVAFYENQGMTPQEVVSKLDSFTPDEVQAVTDYYNARAKLDGFMMRSRDRINERAALERSRRTFKGTINGQANTRDLIEITDGTNSYTLVNGIIDTDETGRVTGRTGVVIGLDKGGNIVTLKDNSSLTVLPSEVTLDAWEENFIRERQENATAAIDPTNELNEEEQPTGNTQGQAAGAEAGAENGTGGNEAPVAAPVSPGVAMESQPMEEGGGVNIPMDEATGVPLYEQGVSVDDAIKDIRKRGRKVDEWADVAISEAQEELNKMKKPKTRAEYIKNEARAKELQNIIDYYNNVKARWAEMNRAAESEENVNVESEAPNNPGNDVPLQEKVFGGNKPKGKTVDEKRAERIKKAKEQYGDDFDDDFTTARTAEELASMYIGRNRTLSREDLSKALGYKLGINTDEPWAETLLARKGEGKTVWDVAHAAYESDENPIIDNDGTRMFSDQEIYDAIINLFRSARQKSDVMDYVLNGRIAEAEEKQRGRERDEADNAVEPLTSDEEAAIDGILPFAAPGEGEDIPDSPIVQLMKSIASLRQQEGMPKLKLVDTDRMSDGDWIDLASQVYGGAFVDEETVNKVRGYALEAGVVRNDDGSITVFSGSQTPEEVESKIQNILDYADTIQEEGRNDGRDHVVERTEAVAPQGQGREGQAEEGGNGPEGQGSTEPVVTETPAEVPQGTERDEYLKPRNEKEEKIIADVMAQLQQEIDAAIKARDKAANDLQKAQAKESDRATDMFSDDEAFQEPGQLFSFDDMGGTDRTQEGVNRRTAAERKAFEDAKKKVDRLQSEAERNSRIRGALDNERRQTSFTPAADATGSVTGQPQSREEYVASHPLTEEQIMADTDATEDEKLNAIDFLKGEDDSAISRFYYDSIYERAKGAAVVQQPTGQQDEKEGKKRAEKKKEEKPYQPRWQHVFHYDKETGRAWITRDDWSGGIPIEDGRWRVEGKSLAELRGILENPKNNLGELLKEVEAQLHNAEVGEEMRRRGSINSDPMAAIEDAARLFRGEQETINKRKERWQGKRVEQKSQDQADIDAALQEFSDFLDNAKGSNVLDKFMRKGLEGNDKAQASLLDAFTLTNEAQRMFLKDLLRLASKVGYAYIKSGVHDVQAWSRNMSDGIGRKLKEVLGWDDAIVGEFVDEVWQQKYTVDGQRMRLSEHAARLKGSSAKYNEGDVVTFWNSTHTTKLQGTITAVRQTGSFGAEYDVASKISTDNGPGRGVTTRDHVYTILEGQIVSRDAKGADTTVNVNKREDNETENDLSLQQKPASELEGDSAEFADRQEKEKALRDDLKQELLHGVGGDRTLKTMQDVKKLTEKHGLDMSLTDLQEIVEAVIVDMARTYANSSFLTDKQKFDNIVALYQTQPTLSARDNDRINKQQYSTPAPMAFLMGLFLKPAMKSQGNGRRGAIGLEPSAGNGMLTIGLPKEGMHVNDIDEMRLSNLQKQGFGEVTSQDGLQPFGEKQYDVVVTNPPFGNVTPKVYDGIYEISGLEHQMAINALESMKDDGRAAIIIGGNTEYNQNGSIKGKDRAFLNYLYAHYNVVDVINMNGHELYARQGTGFPVRMILINGRKEFKPNSFAPTIQKARAERVNSYDELFKRVNDDILSNENKSAGVHDIRSGESDGKHDNGHAGASSETGVRNVQSAGSPRQPAVRPSNGPSVSGSSNTPGRANAESKPAVDTRPTGVGSRTETSQPSGSATEQAGEKRNEPGGNDVERPAAGADNRQRVGQRGAGASQQADGASVVQQQTEQKPEVKRGLGTEKVPYRKQSGNPFTLQSLMPAEQADVVKSALEELGDVDQFLVDELGYSSKEELHQALAAEQIDSVALAIHQMNQGNAFIIGDQTGIGKGRQAAALIRYGVKKGGFPVFITVKKALFSDMYRDLCDIGSPNLRPFIWSAEDTEHSGNVTDKNGNVIYQTPNAKEQKRVVDYINKYGKLPPEYDYVLTTYDSFKSGTMDYEDGNKKARNFGKKKPGPVHFNGQAKRDALETLAQNSYVIMDESHNAGGEGSNVSNYLQYITTKAKGLTFLSATFAKRPGNMPIYSLKTAISKAGVKVGELIDAVKRGGATFQEIMSKALTEAGQMIRRERNMEGVTIDWRGIEDEDVIQKQREQYDTIIGLFNDIIQFQRTYVDPIVNGMNDEAAEEQGEVEHTPGTRDMGINNTPFASRTYNMVQQVLLSLKAEEAAKRAIEHLKLGRKPVITVANTNEGAADEVAGADGESMEMPDLSVNLKKGLQGTMRITKKDGFGNTVNEMIPFDSLSAEGQKRYREIMDAIENASSGLSLSPIDVIKNELKKAGYKVGELTGRKAEFVYNADGTVKRVKRQDTDKKKIASDFNNGNIDALILNRSAGTGISLHASSTFKDQRQRIMIVAQAQGDVNDEVQIRGRIDRTGQVLRGMYEYVVSQIPSEQRLLMMLKAKLRSLDANTTSSQKSKFNEMQVQDIINKYGDDIVIQYLAEHPDLAMKMCDPLKWGEGSETLSPEVLISQAEKAQGDGATASKVLGRMALLTVKEQEKMLAEIGDLYQAEIDRLNEMGENDLEITEMPLRAKTLKKDVWEEGVEPGGNNPFADNSYVEEVEMDVLRKPMKAEEVKKSQTRLLGGKTPSAAAWESYKQAQLAKVEKWAEEKKSETTQTITERAEKKANAEQEKYVKGAKKAQEKNGMTDAEIEKNGKFQYETFYKQEMEKLGNALDAIDKQKQAFVDALETFTTEGVYALPTDIYDLSQLSFEPSFGKVIDIKITDNFSTTASTITFATLDGRRKISIPISGMVKQNNGEKRDIKPVIVQQTAQTRHGMFGSNVANTLKVLEQNVDNWDKLTSTATRKKGYIITGNLLKALTSLRSQGKGGKLISYTTDTGEIRQGILMSDNFDPGALTSKSPISSAKSDLDDWDKDRKIVSADKDVTVKHTGYRWYTLKVPKSKKRGDKYFNDKTLLSLMDGQFEGSTQMSAEFAEENLDAVLKRLDELGVTVESAKEESSSSGRRFDEDIEEKGTLSAEEGKAKINELSAKYHTQAPIVVTKLNGSDKELLDALYEADELEDVASTEEERHLLAETIRLILSKYGGGYFDFLKKIIIFADELPANEYEHAFFHENIHAILDKMDEDTREDILLNYWIDSPEEVDGVSKSEINTLYEDESLERRQEEFFAKSLSRCMEHGLLDLFEKYIKDISDKKTLDKILNDIGYDKGRENSTRKGVHPSAERRYSSDKGETTVNTQQKGEQKRRIAKHIAKLLKKLGTKSRTTVYHSLDDVPEDVRKHIEEAHKRGRKVRGWYENGHIYLFLPDIDSIYQAEKTIWHETVAHHGLRQLIGAENLDKLLKQLWLTHRGGEMGKWIAERMQRNGWALNEAIEEYLAREAEKNPFKEPGLWQRLRWLVADVLHKLGFASDPTIADIHYLLWVSQNQLREGDPMTKIKQQAFLHRLERAAVIQPYTGQYVNMNAERVEDIYNPEAEGAYDDGSRYSEETDEEVIERLEKEPKIKVYRAMQLIDGKLYPPMAAKQGGKLVNPIELGKWEKADEHPEMADNNGKFKLDKGNGKSLKAAYNPYIHTSTTMLNDQFSEAQSRPNLVVVEVEVPESELTSGYKAEKAKDSVGKLEWKAGVIQGQLTGTREVILSRWDKPIRIVPTEEVAKSIAEQLNGKVDVMPTNVVTPQQRAELEKLGVKFVETDNRGKITAGENKGKTYSSVYSRPKSAVGVGRRFDEDIDDPLTYSAKKVYDDRLNRVETVFSEAYQDAMVSLKTAQNAIAGDKDIPDSQNAYMAENLMHGKNKNEMDLFNRMFRDPLIATINKIMTLTGMNWGDVDRYVYTKSGLERNRELFVRDWLEKERKKAETDERRSELDEIEQRWQRTKDRLYEYLTVGDISYRGYLDGMSFVIRRDIDKDYDPSKHDYSGFRAMYGEDYDEEDIVKELMETEAKMEDGPDGEPSGTVATLWEQIRAATRYGLERYREAGMRSDEQIDSVEQMFHFYVPMRGFKEDRGEDMYQYFTGKDRAKSYVGGLLKHAKGRGSEASFPISTIFSMSYKAISDCNQNLVNQKLYRLCQAHPNDLVVLSDSWAVLNEQTGEWEESAPEIPEDADEEEVRSITKSWEERMRQMASEGKAKKITGKATFDYKPIDKKKRSEHIVDVRVNGQPKKMIVTGNPRMAQALNGQLRFEHGKNVFSRWNAAIKNFMASVFTSYSPTFALRNMARDWTHFRMMLGVREGQGYASAANKYYRKSLFKMVGLFKKYREGTLNENNEMERDFKDFMDNGGITGFVQMQKVDDIQKEMEKLYKQQKAGKPVRLNNKLWDATLGLVEAFNEAIENNARFATYRASRHYAGRTKARSAYDAKEITVNFNRKGAGGKTAGFKSSKNRVEDAAKLFGITSQLLGEGRIFFNATVQAIATTFKNFQNADGSLNGRYIARWASMYALPSFLFGLALPYINQMLAASLGGDDDDNPYANLPEWTRRKNLCFYVGDNNFITLPVGQELAAFLSLGDIFAGMTYAPYLKPVDRSLDEELVDVMSTFSPVDIGTKITQGGLFEDPVSEVVGRTFSVLAPLVAVEQNLSWTGRPIYREDRFPNDQYTPEYQMVYSGTNPVLVEASRKLHELGGGDEIVRGKNVTEVNPAIVQYLWEQYTGGPGKVFSNTISLGKDFKDLITSGSAPEFNMRKVEGAKAFFQQGDDRTEYYRIQAKWRKYSDDAKQLQHDYTGYAKAAGNDPTARIKLEEIQRGEDFVRMQIVKQAERGLNNLNKAANQAEGEERRELRRQYNEQLKTVVDMLDEVGTE